MKVADLLAVQNLLSLYGFIFDECARGERPWEDLGLVLSEDVIYDCSSFGAGKFVGLSAIIEQSRNAVHPWGHHMTNPIITPISDDEIHVRSKLIAVLPDGRASTGHYIDVVKRLPEGWRLTVREPWVRSFDLTAPFPVFVNDSPDSWSETQ